MTTNGPLNQATAAMVEAMNVASKQEAKSALAQCRDYCADAGNDAEKRRLYKELAHVLKNLIRRY